MFLPTKSWKTFLKSCSEKLNSTFFPYYPELPERLKQKNSCSKMWLIDQLFIELGHSNYYWWKDRQSYNFLHILLTGSKNQFRIHTFFNHVYCFWIKNNNKQERSHNKKTLKNWIQNWLLDMVSYMKYIDTYSKTVNDSWNTWLFRNPLIFFIWN